MLRSKIPKALKTRLHCLSLILNFTVYTQCENCYNRHFEFGTPEILRDYGFVEQYPQRWIFHKREVGFDIVEDTPGSGKLELIWLDGRVNEEFDYLFEVTDEGIAFLRSHLGRLKSLNETVLQPLFFGSPVSEVIPRNELKTLVEYYEALTTAIEMAVEASKDYNYKNPVNFDDDNDDDDEGEIHDDPDDDDDDENEAVQKTEDFDHDDDDDDDDEWGDNEDCPGGMFVKGRCVTDIGKWEEL